VSGSFTAGNFVPLTVTFGNGERVEMKVPVVPNDTGDYAGLDSSSASPTESPSESSSESPSESSTESPSESPSATASE
jgi:hypothetical protein